MTKYNVEATITISVNQIIEASSQDEANALALGTSPDSWTQNNIEFYINGITEATDE